ncbi:MAG: RHS repeat-associated core domain-containing protein [bacterium]
MIIEIAPFFRDLNPRAGGKITYKDLGDKWVMSWEDIPLYWPRDKKETFQVILNVDGSIIFQYKDLQRVDSWVKAGIEDERGKEGIGISQTSLANGKAYEIVRVVQKLESPPAEKVTITSKTSYVYGNGQLVAKLQEEPIGSSPKVYYYHNDHLGSARAITDKDGKVVEQYFYYPFGGGGPVGGPTFTGKELDDSGLFYFGARYYDPALGRFITPDPIQAAGQNLYVYCYNNPLGYVDPNGEWAFIPFLISVFKVYSIASTIYNIYQGYKYGGFEGAIQAGMVSFASWMLTSSIDFGNELWQDMLEGALSGAISGGISALVYGGDFGKAMYQGAGWGAAGGAIGHWAEKVMESYENAPKDEATLYAWDKPEPGKGRWPHASVEFEGGYESLYPGKKMSLADDKEIHKDKPETLYKPHNKDMIVKGLDKNKISKIDKAWTPYSYNCADHAQAVLQAGGAQFLPKLFINTPNSLYYRVQIRRAWRTFLYGKQEW